MKRQEFVRRVCRGVLSADGTELVIPVPANAEKGFMVLESGEASK